MPQPSIWRKSSEHANGKSPDTELAANPTLHSIPVRITCDGSNNGNTTVNTDPPNFNIQNHDDVIDDDVELTEYVRKRTKHFFVGGFKSSITEDKLIKYVERRGLTVTWVNIWTAKSGRLIIRLNIEVCKDYRRISEPGFWPKGVSCRPWVTKNTYNSRSQPNSYDAGREYYVEPERASSDHWGQYAHGNDFHKTY